MECERACKRDPERHRRVECRRVRSLAATAAAVCLGALTLAGGARAAAMLQFSHAQSIDSHAALSAVSCVSEARCLAVDAKGDVLESSDAAAAQWGTPAQVDEERALTSISCTPEGFCLAADAEGGLLGSRGAGQAFVRHPSGEGEIASVSCASRSLCAAVSSGGEVLVSADPAASSPSWIPVAVEHVGLRAVSCSGSICVAAGAGYVAASSEPARPHSWTARAIDAGLDISALSCGGGGETCVAVDEGGAVLASADAARPSATWSSTPVAARGDLDGVSCASTGLCLAVGVHGGAFAADDAAAPTPGWSEYPGGGELVGVACLEGGLCVAVTHEGDELTASVPPPNLDTTTAEAITSAGATLEGTLNAEDADVTSCDFEYGTSTAYGASVPCAGVPAAAAGAQPVSAELANLAPNTTYHYRLAASSARGLGAGTDSAFTTEVSSVVAIVQPHPSISATPAVGSTLTCHSGLATGSEAHAAYQWLRDQLAIPNATASTYKVRGADNGAHLQCQVTATDGGGSASATSAFVTVPYQSPPAADGETAVGRAAQSGARIGVPVTCAADASDGCTITLRADSRQARGGALALAAGVAHLGAGASATIAATLSHAAQRLLGARRRLAATVSVSGTVVGVIAAQLSTQSLELSEAAARPRTRKGSRAVLLATALPRSPARSAGTNASLAAARPASPLSPTPYMGWDTYFAFGGDYDEATVLEQASRLISLGLARAGYRYVWLDVGWWQGARAPGGQIEVNAAQWPHGMAWLARTLHAAGLRVGLYTDAGANGCGGIAEGSYGHYQQDVDSFAAWGFDAVKVDFCGGAELRLDPAAAYGAFHQAIAHNSSRRAMLLDVCDFLQPEQYSETQPTLAESAFASYEFGPAVANSWRTDTDVGLPHDVHFADVLRNMDADAAAPQAAGPGHWNDPDYLAPDQGLSPAQFRTQFSMWSMLAAPLMISDNLDTISRAGLQTARAGAVIAVDQDPAARQGTLLSSSSDAQVWVKPLAGGARAVALLNRGGAPVRISTSTAALALAFAPPYRVSNLWSGAVSEATGELSAEVPPQSTVLLRVAPA